MASIEVYTFEDRKGNEWGTFSTQDPREAREYAARNNLRLIENVYEWTEAVMIEDFTEDPEPSEAE